MQNFKSFREAEIMFPERGLVLLSGRDLQTGESSGTGKSNVMLALAYALDILPTGTTIASLQSWNSEIKPQVELEFTDGSLIKRGKETSFTSNGIRVSGAKATEEALKKYFGVEPEVLRALCFRSQSRPNSFLGLEPTGKLKFLTAILQLDKIIDAVESAKTSVSKLETERDTLTRFIAPVQYVEVEFQIDEVNSKINHLTLDRAQELESTKDYSSEIEKAKTLLRVLQRKQEEARAAQVAEKQTLYSKSHQIVNQIVALQNKLRRAYDQNTKLASFKESTCPECGTLGYQPEVIAKIEETIRSEELDSTIITENIAKLNLEKERIEQQQNSIDLPQSNPKIEKLYEVINDLQRRQNEEKLKIQKIDSEIAILQAEVRRLKEFATRQLEESNKQRKLAESVVRLNTEIQKEKDFVALCGKDGFLSSIMADVLAEIASEANSILRRLSNVSTVTISFTTESESANKKKIETWVDVRGIRTKIEEGCSGGMMTSINQAVDLGLIDVISRRFGANPQWLCLDEVFNGQGSLTKESALEVLKESAKDNLILVIDHGTDFKEFFSQTIEVVFDNGVSSIYGT